MKYIFFFLFFVNVIVFIAGYDSYSESGFESEKESNENYYVNSDFETTELNMSKIKISSCVHLYPLRNESYAIRLLDFLASIGIEGNLVTPMNKKRYRTNIIELINENSIAAKNNMKWKEIKREFPSLSRKAFSSKLCYRKIY
jgi:hypothetical protein